MEDYISKSALVAEIERRILNYTKRYDELAKYEVWITAKEIEHRIQGLKEALSIINTIEVKEVDLEKEIDFAMPSKYCWSGDGEAVYSKEQMRNFAKYFFELGLKTQKGK